MFKLWAALSGLVPRIAIIKGRCFAGNAVIAGCSDLIVATEDASIGMGGPAMIAGGGDGRQEPARAGAHGGLAGRAPGSDGTRGAVRLGLRKELEAIADQAEREARVRQATAAAQENAKALNAAQLFEIDDVIDPADTRGLIVATLAAAPDAEPQRSRRRFVDTW